MLLLLSNPMWFCICKLPSCAAVLSSGPSGKGIQKNICYDGRRAEGLRVCVSRNFDAYNPCLHILVDLHHPSSRNILLPFPVVQFEAMFVDP